MRPFLTLPTLGSIDARAEEGELNHQLLVVNPNGEQWANSIVQTSATVRLSMCRLFYSSSDAYLVEDATNGNGASLCNISESIEFLRRNANWASAISVIQNGGHGSRISGLARGNKGSVELFPDITMYDLARRQARIFNFGHLDCVQIAPIDMLQLPANLGLSNQIAAGLTGRNLVVASIPVVVETLSPEQLAKWGFLCTYRQGRRVIGFVEHPGTLEKLLEGLPGGDLSEFDLYFSTFRFFLSTGTLTLIADAIRPVLETLSPGQKVDLSDHVIEPLFNDENSTWRAKHGGVLSHAGSLIAKRLRIAGIGINIASIGNGISEDLGTHEALAQLRAIKIEYPTIWDQIQFAFAKTAQ